MDASLAEASTRSRYRVSNKHWARFAEQSVRNLNSSLLYRHLLRKTLISLTAFILARQDVDTAGPMGRPPAGPAREDRHQPAFLPQEASRSSSSAVPSDRLPTPSSNLGASLNLLPGLNFKSFFPCTHSALCRVRTTLETFSRMNAILYILTKFRPPVSSD